MNTKLLQYAVELTVTGSTQKVADKYAVSRSSVSRNIKRLESELGTPIFIKLQDGLSPTCMGDVFLRYARQILRMEEDLRFSLASDQTYQGIVNVGMGTSRTMVIPSLVLPEFSKKYPNISVQLHEMSTSDLMEALLSRQLDFAVVSKTLKTEGIRFEPLMYEELVLVAPRGDSFAREHSTQIGDKRFVCVGDFRDKPFILGHQGQKSRFMSDALFMDEGFSANVIFQSENCYALAVIANNGFAYALVPHSVTNINGNTIEHYHIKANANTGWYVGIASLSDSKMSKAAMQLKNTMLEILMNEK